MRPAEWIRHDYKFGNGAEIGIYDVNGDGLNDVVTAVQAHGYGLVWHEQKRDAKGVVAFVRHDIMTGPNRSDNAGGVVFSEPHGATFADMNGDGIKDFIVGKRVWSHLDTFGDPDPHSEAVLVHISRGAQSPGARAARSSFRSWCTTSRERAIRCLPPTSTRTASPTS